MSGVVESALLKVAPFQTIIPPLPGISNVWQMADSMSRGEHRQTSKRRDRQGKSLEQKYTTSSVLSARADMSSIYCLRAASANEMSYATRAITKTTFQKSSMLMNRHTAQTPMEHLVQPLHH